MKTDMNKKQKNTRTFLIKIMDQQNGTWQGNEPTSESNFIYLYTIWSQLPSSSRKRNQSSI